MQRNITNQNFHPVQYSRTYESTVSEWGPGMVLQDMQTAFFRRLWIFIFIQPTDPKKPIIQESFARRVVGDTRFDIFFAAVARCDEKPAIF